MSGFYNTEPESNLLKAIIAEQEVHDENSTLTPRELRKKLAKLARDFLNKGMATTETCPDGQGGTVERRIGVKQWQKMLAAVPADSDGEEEDARSKKRVTRSKAKPKVKAASKGKEKADADFEDVEEEAGSRIGDDNGDDLVEEQGDEDRALSAPQILPITPRPARSASSTPLPKVIVEFIMANMKLLYRLARCDDPDPSTQATTQNQQTILLSVLNRLRTNANSMVTPEEEVTVNLACKAISDKQAEEAEAEE